MVDKIAGVAVIRGYKCAECCKVHNMPAYADRCCKKVNDE